MPPDTGDASPASHSRGTVLPAAAARSHAAIQPYPRSPHPYYDDQSCRSYSASLKSSSFPRTDHPQSKARSRHGAAANSCRTPRPEKQTEDGQCRAGIAVWLMLGEKSAAVRPGIVQAPALRKPHTQLRQTVAGGGRQ
jgi:hypothetical protein